MNKNVKVPKPSQLTLAQVFEIFNEECPNDGMCMLIDKYAKKKTPWKARGFGDSARVRRDSMGYRQNQQSR